MMTGNILNMMTDVSNIKKNKTNNLGDHADMWLLCWRTNIFKSINKICLWYA